MDEDALVRSHWSEQFCKPLGFRAGFHGSQKRQRITATSRFGKQTDFQCAQSVRKAPYHLIIVSRRITWSQPPSGSSARPSMLKANGTLNARATTLPADADESIVEVQIEY
jgi:hypothetical protein